jgi:hypothetical protein
MSYSPILIAHICGGVVGLVSGTAAMCFRKGSSRHVLAGRIFVASMLTMGALAAYLAITRHQPNNIGGGILTFYLIGTAWLTARRKDGETSRLDWVALLIPLANGILSWMTGLKVVRSGASSQNGVPVGMILFMGSVCLLAAAGDVRMLLRGGVAGVKRISRHLWRMCFGLFIAAGSFFFGGSNRPLRLLSTVGLGKYLSPALFNTTLYLVHHPSADFAYFLAGPSTLHKCIQRKVDDPGQSCGIRRAKTRTLKTVGGHPAHTHLTRRISNETQRHVNHRVSALDPLHDASPDERYRPRQGRDGRGRGLYPSLRCPS